MTIFSDINNSKIIPAIHLLIIIIVTFSTFLPCLNNGFISWDDPQYLLNNSIVRNLNFRNLKNLFTQKVLNNYNPLTIISFAFEYKLFKYNPFIYHLNNILLHIGVVILAYIFALQCGLSNKGAFFSSLLFAIHPIHVESVAWTTERKDVLYALFYMASVCVYLVYIKKQNLKYLTFSILLGLLSMLAKPMALSLPLILLTCDWLKEREFNKNVFAEKIIYFLYIIPIGWLTYMYHARLPGEGLLKSFLIWAWTFSFYIKTFLFPAILLPLYSLPKPVSIYNASYITAILIFTLTILLLIKFRKNRYFIFAFCFYFFSIFFLLRFDTHKDINIVADRFMYLPCLGICILIGLNINKLLINLNKTFKTLKLFIYLILFFTVIILCLKTFNQCKLWNNELVLWNYSIDHELENPKPYDLKATYYFKIGHHIKAIENFKKAIKLDPEDTDYYKNLSLAYLNRGEVNKSIEVLQNALKINHYDPVLFNNLAVIYRSKEMFSKSEEYFLKSINLDQKNIYTRLNLVRLYSSQGQIQKAIDLCKENLTISHNDKNSLIELLNIYAADNRKKQAEDLGYEILNSIKDIDLILSFAMIFAENNHNILAFKLYEKALILYPNNKKVYLDSGEFFVNLGKPKQAIEVWENGLKLFPNEDKFNIYISKTKNILTGEKNDRRKKQK